MRLLILIMGNINYSAYILNDIEVPGVRLNPQLLGDLKSTEENLLLREQEEAMKRYDEIKKIEEEGDTKQPITRILSS